MKLAVTTPPHNEIFTNYTVMDFFMKAFEVKNKLKDSP